MRKIPKNVGALAFRMQDTFDGHTFLGHFLTYRAEIFFVTQKIMIYRLVTRNYDFDAFLEKSYFWRENGRFRHRGAKGSGASKPNQKVAH